MQQTFDHLLIEPQSSFYSLLCTTFAETNKHVYGKCCEILFTYGWRTTCPFCFSSNLFNPILQSNHSQDPETQVVDQGLRVSKVVKSGENTSNNKQYHEIVIAEINKMDKVQFHSVCCIIFMVLGSLFTLLSLRMETVPLKVKNFTMASRLHAIVL